MNQLADSGSVEPPINHWVRPHNQACAIQALAREQRSTVGDLVAHCLPGEDLPPYERLIRLHEMAERQSFAGVFRAISEEVDPSIPRAAPLFAREALMPEEVVFASTATDDEGFAFASPEIIAERFQLPLDVVSARLDDLGIRPIQEQDVTP